MSLQPDPESAFNGTILNSPLVPTSRYILAVAYIKVLERPFRKISINRDYFCRPQPRSRLQRRLAKGLHTIRAYRMMELLQSALDSRKHCFPSPTTASNECIANQQIRIARRTATSLRGAEGKGAADSTVSLDTGLEEPEVDLRGSGSWGPGREQSDGNAGITFRDKRMSDKLHE